MSIHDPLLPPPPPSPRSGRTEPARRSRRPSPAASARILATGLATTAMLGLTTGYAFARKAQQPENTPNVSGTPSLTNPDGSATNPDGSTTTPDGSATTPTVQTQNTVAPSPRTEAQQPVVTSPPVVEIPVPTVAPAQPGNNWNGGNNQPSSGSN